MSLGGFVGGWACIQILALLRGCETMPKLYNFVRLSDRSREILRGEEKSSRLGAGRGRRNLCAGERKIVGV